MHLAGLVHASGGGRPRHRLVSAAGPVLKQRSTCPTFTTSGVCVVLSSARLGHSHSYTQIHTIGISAAPWICGGAQELPSQHLLSLELRAPAAVYSYIQWQLCWGPW
jgi:hypothetical protein